ncbi:hypothetical protein FGIG_12352 [Fasciola gigantica]|uniref:Uncharacterized protein n=1 Tax=Fasciola gigantica TaxID=46835 RepID=A0A504YTQ1_FASGI|nr:hypothetical protein FGIG_12352 [Fasciola gigantica]
MMARNECHKTYQARCKGPNKQVSITTKCRKFAEKECGNMDISIISGYYSWMICEHEKELLCNQAVKWIRSQSTKRKHN